MQADVLAVLRQGETPLSAYDVMGELRGKHPKIAPPTVYRALTALMEQGCVHRIESMNAFMPCGCEGHDHSSLMSICDDCGAVEETVAPDVVATISGLMSKSGFAPSRHVIEVHGLCASCDNEKASP